MNEQTMVAELVTAPAVSPGPAGRAKLLVPKAAAVQQVKAHVDRGVRLSRAGIGSMEDLDALRAKKQEWVQSYTDLLLGLYEETSSADECNDWVGPILPEYADLELFADQFYEEVTHRLRRLRAVLKRLNETPEVVRRMEPVQDVRAAGDGEGTPDTADRAVEAKSEPPKTVAATRPAPAAPKAAAPAAAAAVKGVIVADGDDAVKPLVVRFMEEMEVGLVELPAQPGGGDSALNGASFAVVVLPAGDAGALSGAGDDALPAHCRAALFRLGYLAGRLGAQRVFAIYPSADGAATIDARHGPGEHGVSFLPLDAAGGWQLNLARGLRRAGVPVDLNRIC